jgi:hypothetical protein
MKLRTFVVCGSGDFPYDMLRYDACWPATEGDSALLSPRYIEHRQVTLETISGFETTPERWKSFLWEVL